MMTYEQLLEHIISDGISEVRDAYDDPKDHHKRDGAIEGFEACRGKTPTEIVELWRIAEDQARQIMRANHADTPNSLKDYWKQRYKASQLEWALNVISIGLVNNGQPPLLTHLPTAHAAMKYAAIVGVHAKGVGA